jgi:hypothetical protein
MELRDARMRISRYMEVHPLGVTAKVNWTFRKLELELTSCRVREDAARAFFGGLCLGCDACVQKMDEISTKDWIFGLSGSISIRTA